MRSTLAWPVALLCLCGGAQSADLPAVRVAVYDFAEPGDYGGHLVGRRAAEAVQVALAATGAWELVDRGALLRACAAEGAEAPFGVGYLQMFGRRLDASLALAGLTETCAVNPGQGTAQVTLVAELIEAIGGEGLGLFRGVGSSSRGAEEAVTLDEVLDRALTEAAGNLVVHLTSFNAWSTTVTARMGEDQVLMQPRAEPQVALGEKAIVCRRGPEAWTLVAVVEVQRADETSVRARIVSQLSAPQPHDVAVCVAR